jgi:hypothetical protein
MMRTLITGLLAVSLFHMTAHAAAWTEPPKSLAPNTLSRVAAPAGLVSASIGRTKRMIPLPRPRPKGISAP